MEGIAMSDERHTEGTPGGSRHIFSITHPTDIKHVLWRLVWDIGGEVTMMDAAEFNRHQRPWRKGRMLRLHIYDNGELVVMAEGTDEDYAEMRDLPPLKEVMTNIAPTSSPFLEMIQHRYGRGTPT